MAASNSSALGTQVGGGQTAVQTPATVRGEVRDASDAIVPGATVTLTQDGEVATVKTGPDGRFTFGDVRPGSYVLSVAARGFEDQVQSLDVDGRGSDVLVVYVSPARLRQDVVVSATRVITPTASLPNTVTVVDRARDHGPWFLAQPEEDDRTWRDIARP
jgi:hypothetical protein